MPSRRSSRRRTGLGARLVAAARRFGLALAALVALAWAGAWLWIFGGIDSIGKLMIDSAARRGFIVNSVIVEGRAHTDPERLKDAIGVRRGDPVFGFDVREIRSAVESISWVRSARIERRLPDLLYVRIEERAPTALYQEKGALALVDAEGVELTREDLARFSDLPMITGDGAKEKAREIIEMLGAEPEIAKKLDVAMRVGDRRWTLRLKNGVEILLPEADPEAALRRVALAQEKDKALDSPLVAAVDARIPGKLTLRAAPAPQAIAPSAGGKESAQP